MTDRPAPAVLLLHGQPGSARDWRAVVTALGSRARTITFDRPGWDATAATGVAGNARAAVAVLDQAGVDRALVVGHSFGGAVAAWLAVTYPERVSRLVLAAPSANVASLTPLDRWLAAPVAGELASTVVLALGGLALGLAPLRRRLARRLGLDERYLASTARRLVRPASWRASAVEQRALVAELPALEAALGTVRAATVIVGGTEDRIVPGASLRQLSGEIPGAELVMLPGAGHLLPMRRPAELAEVIVGDWGARC